MSFDLEELRALVRMHGRVARVVVAATKGSAPRECGAAMVVWEGGQSGTIGGGALELEAARRARCFHDWLDTTALGPGLGQCCGGSVTLLSEVFDDARLSEINGPAFVRRVRGDRDMPLKLKKMLSDHKSGRDAIVSMLAEGWMIEPISAAQRPLWIYGAGHVGRAVVNVLAPLPGLAITWIDSDQARFPGSVPENVTQLVSRNPADAVNHAPVTAGHLIFTYSHAIDLEICHRLLGHGFRSAGLIGSKTKWARFRKRLKELGHTDEQIARITCPIGRPELGKHPQAIAVGVAADLLDKLAHAGSELNMGGVSG